MKRTISLLCLLIPLALVVVLSLAACGAPIKTPASGEPSAAGQTNTAAPVVSGKTADVTPEPSTTLPPVRAIVFDATIDDPVQAALQDGGGLADGKSSLKLTLYETVPGVFEGEGTLNRVFDNQFPGNKSSGGYYYRTGRLSLKQDEATRVSMLARGDSHSEQDIYGIQELGAFIFDVNLNVRDQFGLTLSIDGDAAKLTLTTDNVPTSFAFDGKVTELSPPTGNAAFTAPADKMIYINSSFHPSDGGYEYRAILTAKPSADGIFTGKLCVYAGGGQMPYADDSVSFKLSAFDEGAYRADGGKLSGSFDAFGVVQGSNTGYIVLIDGGRPLIESVNSDAAFYGSLLPLTQADAANHEAEETKPLMKTLYDGAGQGVDMADFMKQFQGKDATDPAVQKELQDFAKNAAGGFYGKGKPAWYPDWLLPKPLKLDDGGNYIDYKTPDLTPYMWYKGQYDEEPMIDEIFASYTSQMSGMEGYDARHDAFSNLGDPQDASGEACIVFKKGAYSILITMMQSPFHVGVNVTII